ncbi:hypothetical protein AB0878_44930 [Amycolatopsis sp. NPDC047767]|uniref:DUF7715 family protein n=1 Tax=Amycolatopsis sp. NPDC047767 TaxID=3156765 RepID=UPI003452853E
MSKLRVLVATARTQGWRPADFLACDDGELVAVTTGCERGNARCGCDLCRVFTGLESRKAATTAEVIEIAMSVDEYLTEYRASLFESGVADTEHNRSEIEASAHSLLAIADELPVGTVIERLGEEIIERSK